MDAHRPVIGADVAAGADGGLTAGYDLGHVLRRDVRGPGAAAAALPAARRAPGGDERGTARGADPGRERVLPHPGHRLHGLRRRRRHRPDLPVRPRPPDRAARRVGDDRARPRAAAARAEPLPRRHLPPPADPRSRHRARRPRLRLAELPARDDRLRRAGETSTPTSAASTSSATATAATSCSRTTCGPRRASATCSRAGRRSSASSRPLFDRYGVRADRPVPARACSRPCAPSPRAPREASRASSSSPRARTTRPTSSTRSSPGRWGSSSSRPAISSSTATASSTARRAACSASTSIYRRIDDDFLDPLAFRRGQPARRAGPPERLPRRERDAGERDRNRRRGRQGDLPVRPRHDPLLPRARTRSSRTSRPTRRRTPTIARTCSTTSRSSSSRRSTSRAATGC